MIDKNAEEFTLTSPAIEKVSLHCEKDLTEAGIDEKEILHIRKALEEILGVWLENLGGARMKCRTVRKFLGNYVEIAVEGPRVDIQEDDIDRQFLFVNKLIAESAIAPVYSYGDGLNVLTIKFPKKIKIGQAAQMLIAIAAAVICGCIGRMLFPADIQSAVLYVTNMLFNRMSALLVAIASLMIFFSVCNSITSIGDLSLLGRMGRRTACFLLFVSFFFGVLLVFIFSFFIPIAGLGVGGINIELIDEIVNLLVDILPPDVISPFMKCNIMQIVFLGGLLGIIILCGGDTTATVRNLTEELGKITLETMNFLLKYIYILVFLSIFNLIFMKVSAGFVNIAVMFLLSAAAYHAILIIYFFASVISFHVKPEILFKKLLKIYLIGFSTCTGEASFMFVLENSEKIMGIKKAYSDFVNSIAFSIFRPQNVASYIIFAIMSAEIFNLTITVQFIITVLLLSFFFSMSPSTVAMLPILFQHLGIPGEALAAAIAVNAIQRSIKSAIGPVLSLLGSLSCAGINGMLDKNILRKGVDMSAFE